MAFPTAKPFEVPETYLTEIGRIAIEWSHLEHKLEEAIWHLLKLQAGRHPHLAEATTTHIPFRVRMDMIASICVALELPAHLMDQVKTLQDEVGELHARRNLAIHSEWSAYTPTNHKVVKTDARQPKGVKVAVHDMSLEDLKLTATQITGVRERFDGWTWEATRWRLSQP